MSDLDRRIRAAIGALGDAAGDPPSLGEPSSTRHRSSTGGRGARLTLLAAAVTVAVGLGTMLISQRSGSADDQTTEAIGHSDTQTDADSVSADATTTSTTAPPTTNDGAPAAAGVPESELPGDDAGDGIPAPPLVSVVGVRFDDVLNVRRLPDRNAEIVGRLGPLESDIATTGRIRRIADSETAASLWFEIVTADGMGWVNKDFVAVVGGPGDDPDDTARFLEARADGVMPSGATPTEVAERFGELMTQWELAHGAGDDGHPAPRFAIVTDPRQRTEGVLVDLHFVGDDAQAGTRYGLEITSTGDGFTLVRVVAIGGICARGGTSGGSCL